MTGTMNEQDMFHSLHELQKLLKGSADSQPMAMLNNVMAETLGMSMHNAVNNQHNAQLVNTAATTTTCARILAASTRNQPVTPVKTEQKAGLPAGPVNSPVAGVDRTHQTT